MSATKDILHAYKASLDPYPYKAG
ncbi:hypothetical protein Ccrd_003314, partial [Cynara cardunculus var. scolymus]